MVPTEHEFVWAVLDIRNEALPGTMRCSTFYAALYNLACNMNRVPEKIFIQTNMLFLFSKLDAAL